MHLLGSSIGEMCLMFIERLEDYAPLPEAAASKCSASAGCLASCAGSPTRCLLECEDTEFACVGCVVNAVPGCAIDCTACLDGHIAGGTCSAPLAACGAEL